VARWELRDAQGQRVEIAPLPFRLLVFLLEHRQRVVAKEELFAELWGDAAVNEGSLTQAISIVRRALAGAETGASVIQNVRGRGYRLAAPVEVVPERTEVRADALSEARPAAPASSVFPAIDRDGCGRVAELERVKPALQGALDGRGAAILISGGAGIGKSWLAGEVLARMVARGALRCEARGYEDQGAPAMWVLRQLALALVREHRDAGAQLEAEHAAELRMLAPELAPQLEAAAEAREAPLRTPSEQRFFVFSALLALIERASRRQPVAIVIEDLHWVDEATLLFLARLALDLPRLRVLLVCTYRDAAAPALERTVAALSSDSASVLLALPGLAAPAVRALLAAHGVPDPSPQLLERALQLTQGNPLFVTQLARWLAAEGAAGGVDPERLALPEASRAVLRRQVAGLPEATRRCLELAAALGDDFHLGELQRVAGEPHEALLQQLEPAYAARLLVRDAQQGWIRRFGHPSIRTAIYEGIDEPQRLQLHLRVAEALTRNAPDGSARINAIAHHYHEAAPLGATAQALHYGWLAAQASFAATAYEDAVGHCQRILAVLQVDGDAALRCDTHLLLGHALRLSGAQVALVRETFSVAAKTARELADPERLAQAAMSFAGRGPFGFELLRTIGTVDPAEIELLESAVRLLPEGDSPARARALCWLGLSLYNTDQEARKSELVCAGVAMARRLDDVPVLVETLFIRQQALRAPDGLQQRMNDLREAMALATSAGIRTIALDAGDELAWSLFEAGDAEAAELQMQKVVRAAESVGRPQDRRREVRFRVMRVDAAGRFAEAEALLEAARTQSSWPPEHVQTTAIRLFMLQYLLGNAATTIAQLEAMAQRFPLPVAWHCGLVSTYTSIGRMDDAQRELERLWQGDFAIIPNDHNRVSSHVNLAFGAIKLKHLPACTSLRRKLEPYAERNVIVGLRGYYYGTVSRVLGLLNTVLGDYEQALRWSEHAIERDRAMGSTVYEAWDRLTHAEADLARGGRDSRARADRQIARALRLVRRLPEMPPLLEMVARLKETTPGRGASAS
jgi:DNA-binding winged helix-turn-helix (wHTH) protein